MPKGVEKNSYGFAVIVRLTKELLRPICDVLRTDSSKIATIETREVLQRGTASPQDWKISVGQPSACTRSYRCKTDSNVFIETGDATSDEAFREPSWVPWPDAAACGQSHMIFRDLDFFSDVSF